MRALLDTNIVLDLLLKRDLFAQDAVSIWEANRLGRFDGYVSAITPITVFYVARKSVSAEEAQRMVEDILKAFLVCAVDLSVLRMALTLPVKDYEDAVQVAGALMYRLDAIVTRDLADYAGATLPVFPPPISLSSCSPRNRA